jgi:hypothetical protein
MIGMKHFDAAQSPIAQLADKLLFGVIIPEAKPNGMRQDRQPSGIDHALDGLHNVRCEALHITRRRFAEVIPESLIEAAHVTLLDQHTREMGTAGQGSSQLFHFAQINVDAPLAQARDQTLVAIPAALDQLIQPLAKVRRRRPVKKISQQMDSPHVCSRHARAQFDSANQVQAAGLRQGQGLIETGKCIVIRNSERLNTALHGEVH